MPTLSFSEKKMRFLEMLFLLAFCLVVAKANDEEIETSGEEDAVFLDEGADITAAEAGPMEDAVFLGEGADITAAEAGPMEDAPGEEVRRQIKPPFVRPIYLTMSVPGNMNSFFFKTCYCFRRICYG